MLNGILRRRCYLGQEGDSGEQEERKSKVDCRLRCSRRAGSPGSRPWMFNSVCANHSPRWLAHLDQVAARIAHVAAHLGRVPFRRCQEFRPRALHSAYTPWMSATRMLRKLLARSGSGGGSSVTASLSSVGPPPRLMMIQLLASARKTVQCLTVEDFG